MRFISLMFSALCAAMAGVIYVAFFRSFNPAAGQFRELDAIAAVIIGGGSIFGGYGTIIGSLAGAAVITLIRALLQLNIITADGRVLRHAAALGQRLHRPDPDRRGAGRHLGPRRPTSSAGCGCGWRDGERSAGGRTCLRPAAAAARRSSRCASISKAFGAVQALNDVDLTLHPGEILGLVGDNSAGKSTLMKVLTGAYHRDSGDVLVDGTADQFPHPAREPRASASR